MAEQEPTNPEDRDATESLLLAREPGPPPVPSDRYAAATIPLRGGRLCLDLTYTLVWRATARPEETLVDYPSVVALMRRAGGIDQAVADGLLAACAVRPIEAGAVVERAIALRESVYRIVVARIARRPPREADLAMLNAELAEAMAAAAVTPAGEGFVWGWDDAAGPNSVSLALPVWTVARSAAELLTSPELGRVRRCLGAGCGWLFLDTSKNGSRRWCSTAGCGNRARVRAHYRRRRVAAPEPGDRPAMPEQSPGRPGR